MSEHVGRPDVVVLAGGTSRRMGQDKALLRLPDGRSTLEAVTSVARQVAGRVLLSVESLEHGAQLYGSLSWRPTLIVDRTPDAGPLAALAGSLRAATTPAVLVLAVDAPLIVPEVLRILHRKWLEDGQVTSGITAPLVGGVVQPMPACYAAQLASLADALLAAGARSMHALAQSSSTCGSISSTRRHSVRQTHRCTHFPVRTPLPSGQHC